MPWVVAVTVMTMTAQLTKQNQAKPSKGLCQFHKSFDQCKVTEGVEDAANKLQIAIHEVIKSQPVFKPSQANVYELTVENALKIAESKSLLERVARRLLEMLEDKLRPQFGRFPGYERRLQSIKNTLNLILNPKKQVSSTDIQDIDTLKQDLSEVKIQSAELQQSTQGNVA